MKKQITLVALLCALSSPAFAVNVVASPPTMDTKKWTKQLDVHRCFASGLRTRAERFYEIDPALSPPNNRLYEERSEDGVVMVVRFAEWTNKISVRDDIYLLNEKWTKFSLLNEAEEFRFALFMHPNFSKWAQVAEAPCPK